MSFAPKTPQPFHPVLSEAEAARIFYRGVIVKCADDIWTRSGGHHRYRSDADRFKQVRLNPKPVSTK